MIAKIKSDSKSSIFNSNSIMGEVYVTLIFSARSDEGKVNKMTGEGILLVS
jgi:hypothetical protein